MTGMFSDRDSPVIQVNVGVTAAHCLAAAPGDPFSPALGLALAEEGYSDVIIAPDRVHAADGDGTRWTPVIAAWACRKPGQTI